MSIRDGIVGAMVVGGGSGSGGGGSVVVPNINATAESLPAGSEATVEKSGSNTNVTFNFGIPRGADGRQGAPGATGPAGQAATIQVGTVTTGAPGTNAQVTNSGTSSEAVFDFVIPRGQDGGGGGTGNPFNSVPITLTAAGWEGDNAPYTQTVSMEGVTADSPVITSPADTTSRANAGAAGVMFDGPGAGTLTFICMTKPSADLNYNAGILTGGGGGSGTAGVSSFNNRTGAVVPQTGDYTAQQVGARPDNWMPTAGDGVSVAGDTISAKVSNQADNIIGMMNGGLYAGAPIPTGVLPLVEITTVPATPSVQVTGTKGQSSVNGTTDAEGKVSIEIPQLGVWTFTATIDGEQATADVAVNASQLYTLTLSPYSVFGVAWDKTNPSTQLTRLTPESDPNGLVTVAVTTEPQPAVGTGNGYSPFDQYLPWSGMEEYNIIDGAVSYKKGQPGFSRTEYDTMVYIPQFYYQTIDSDNILYFYISDQQIEGFSAHPGSDSYVGRYNLISGYFSESGASPLVNITRNSIRTNVTSKGTGWCSFDLKTYCAICFLYIVEFANWDSQTMIGQGIVSASGTQNTGGTDDMNYHTGRESGTEGQTQIQYRWIEGIWGNVWNVIDGINANNGVVYICANPSEYADDTTTNYLAANITTPANGYIRQIGVANENTWALIPTQSGGSSSTYIPDNVYTSSGWNIGATGGRTSFGFGCGLFCFGVNSASSTTFEYAGGRSIFQEQEVTP